MNNQDYWNYNPYYNYDNSPPSQNNNSFSEQYYQSQLTYLYNKVNNLENENSYLKRVINRERKHKNNISNLSFEIIKGPLSHLDSIPCCYKNDISSEKSKEKKDDNLNNGKTCFLPNKDSFSKEKVTELITNLKSIYDIIELPEDKLIRHNKYLNKVCCLRSTLISLNNLVGLKQIKDEIFKHVIYFIMNDNKIKDDHRLHSIIQGPPGVGKTELGKILSKIYLEIGILENDKIHIVKRSDLIGGYLGQTAIKTQEAIDSALGGVLFIDEAYSLGDKNNKDSYSKECIDTINRNLTENGNKFVCIIAGYEKDLKECFFSVNSGLERRFNFKYTIDSYTKQEIKDIFCLKMANQDWDIKIDDNELSKFFENNELPFFGGDIDRLIFQAQLNSSLRTFNEQEYDLSRYINIDDLQFGIEKINNPDNKDNDIRWLNSYM